MDPKKDSNILKMLQSGSSTGNSNKLNPLELKQRNIRVSSKDVLRACREGDNLDQIAKRFKVSRLSAGKLVERLLKKGEQIPLNQFINKECERLIEDSINLLQSSSLKKIVEYLKGQALEEEIRIVRGSLIGKYRDNDFS